MKKLLGIGSKFDGGVVEAVLKDGVLVRGENNQTRFYTPRVVEIILAHKTLQEKLAA